MHYNLSFVCLYIVYDIIHQKNIVYDICTILFINGSTKQIRYMFARGNYLALLATNAIFFIYIIINIGMKMKKCKKQEFSRWYRAITKKLPYRALDSLRVQCFLVLATFSNMFFFLRCSWESNSDFLFLYILSKFFITRSNLMI
jgi:hypothetical protein